MYTDIKPSSVFLMHCGRMIFSVCHIVAHIFLKYLSTCKVSIRQLCTLCVVVFKYTCRGCQVVQIHSFGCKKGSFEMLVDIIYNIAKMYSCLIVDGIEIDQYGNLVIFTTLYFICKKEKQLIEHQLFSKNIYSWEHYMKILFNL